MNSILVDTTVFIYALRKDARALKFLENEFGNFVTSFVSVGELLQGCKSKQHFNSVENLIEKTPIHWGSTQINQRACELLKNHTKNGLQFLDALIAATAIEENLTLITDNLKHFKVIKELEVKSPY